jgi:hypothetical protein
MFFLFVGIVIPGMEEYRVVDGLEEGHEDEKKWSIRMCNNEHEWRNVRISLSLANKDCDVSRLHHLAEGIHRQSFGI